MAINLGGAGAHYRLWLLNLPQHEGHGAYKCAQDGVLTANAD